MQPNSVAFAEWLKSNPESKDLSVLLPEVGFACIIRFVRALISLWILPFYLALGLVLTVGAVEISKANREAFAEAVQKAGAALSLPAYNQQRNIPIAPMRPHAVPMPRSTPSFQTPTHLPAASYPMAPPARPFTNPAPSPNGSSAPR
jgi:hypothetical protein